MQKKAFLKLTAALLLLTQLVPSLAACKSSSPNGETTTAVPTETSAATAAATKAPSAYPTTPQTPAALNLSWDADQLIPTFPSATGELDAIMSNNLTDEEILTITCLQGLVNAKETRLALFIENVEQWANIYGYKSKKAIERKDIFEVLKKYTPEVSGVVLYSRKQEQSCADYANLATSIANMKQAIPMNENTYKAWVKQGIELPVVVDLTELKYTERADLYQYFYNNYWKDCSKRILFIQDPTFYQMRDLASASGSAVIYLSCSSSDAKELALAKKFFADMTPGESLLMGWNGQERELMTTAAAHGLSCVPCDYFKSPSLFAQDLDVKINAVPDMPELENKIYIAFYFSDGDNIQYNMNAMKEYWDSSRAYRSKLPINWTISPSLLDVAPGMMNYYYESATETECFVSGPSGLGYTLPINSFGPNQGNNFTNNDYFAKYVQMSNRYLAATGLRAVTIWDNLTADQREIYSKEGSYLYGLTVQNLINGNLNLGYTGVTNNLLIQQMSPGYFAKNEEGTTPLTDMTGDIERAVNYLKYDGSAPVFISCQVSVWAFHNVGEVIQFEQSLSDKYAAIYGEDVVEFVRADHYFNLYNEANGLPYDLSLRSDIEASARDNSLGTELLLDGTQDTVWVSDIEGETSLVFDLGGNYELSELSIFFAESEGERYTAADNVRALIAEISSDGENWTVLTSLSDNSADWVNLPFDAAEGSLLRLTITDPGESGIAKLADVNIVGLAK